MVGSERRLLSRQVLQLADAFLVLLSFIVATGLWNAFHPLLQGFSGVKLNSGIKSYWGHNTLLYLLVPFTPLVLELFRFYESRFGKRLRIAIWQMLQTLVVIIFVIGLASIFFKWHQLHRPTLVLAAIVAFALIGGREWVLQKYYRKRQKDVFRRPQIAILGNVDRANEWLKSQPEEVSERIHVIEMFDLANREISELQPLLENHALERVVFLPAETPFAKVTKAIELCELQGIEVWVGADFISARIAQPTFDMIGGQSMLVLRSTPGLSWSLLAKELFDRFFALVAIIGSSPLWLLATVGIYFSDRGPVFFRQRRAGRYGKEFRMWKFRTMVVDAEAKLAEVKKTAGNQMSGPVFKLDHDPRVFRFGQFLRKTSIDELPQLLNVLFGDMSIVGPRPLPVYEVDAFEETAHRRRLSVKPGITCTWQAGGRNSITEFDDWVKMDLEYIDNWSLWRDLKLVMKTVPAVLFRKGAK